MRSPQNIIYIVLLGVITFFSGYFNQYIVEFYKNGEALLGICYVVIFILTLVIHRLRDRLSYYQGRAAELEESYYNASREKDILLNKKTLEKPKATKKVKY